MTKQKRIRDCSDLELALRAERIDATVLRRGGYPTHTERMYYHGIARELQRKNSKAAPLYAAKARTVYEMK